MKKISIFAVAILSLSLFVTSCSQNAKKGNIDKTQNPTNFSVELNKNSSIVGGTITYESIDTKGKIVELSGYFEFSNIAPIEQIILFEHGTLDNKSDAPSVTESTEGIPVTTEKNRLVVCPDYLGYGKSKDMIHPYMNEELTAINSIDCLLAVLKQYEDKLSPDAYTVVAGYSQGGGAALAVAKYIDKNLSKEKKSIINFKEAHCGGSPVDLAATMEVYFEEESKIYFPEISITEMDKLTEFAQANMLNIGLSFKVIQGMLESYPNILKNYEIADFYNENIITAKVVEAFECEEEKEMLKCLQDAFMPFIFLVVSQNSNTSLIDIYSDDFKNVESDLHKKFSKCLLKNDLTDWKPDTKLYIYHSTEDDVVPYVNYENLMSENKFGRYKEELSADNLPLINGITGTGTHGTFGLKTFYVKALERIESL